MSRDLTPSEERVIDALRPVFESHDRLTEAVEQMQAAFQLAIAALAALPSDSPAHCCEHDSDAHDGAGCLDCPCPLGPPHVGYSPTPSNSPADAGSASPTA